MGITGDVPLCTDCPWLSSLRSTNKHEKCYNTVDFQGALWICMKRYSVWVRTCFPSLASVSWSSTLPKNLFQSTKENTSKNKHESRRLRTRSSGHAHPVGSLACSTPNTWVLLNWVGVKWMYLSSVIITEVLCSSSSSFVLSCSCKLIQTQTGREWICWEVTYF